MKFDLIQTYSQKIIAWIDLNSKKNQIAVKTKMGKN